MTYLGLMVVWYVWSHAGFLPSAVSLLLEGEEEIVCRHFLTALEPRQGSCFHELGVHLLGVPLLMALVFWGPDLFKLACRGLNTIMIFDAGSLFNNSFEAVG